TGWVTEVAKIPVWAKMTPNITNIKEPASAAVRGGAHGISAINTILSVIGVDLNTLRPMPTVEGHTVPGGYSSQAVKPIALRMVSQLALGLPKDVSISGIGGIETAHDAIEFFLLGASTGQTGQIHDRQRIQFASGGHRPELAVLFNTHGPGTEDESGQASQSR